MSDWQTNVNKLSGIIRLSLPLPAVAELETADIFIFSFKIWK